jgi:hypothetical protein
MYSGGGSKSGTSKNELRQWKHSMGLKTSAIMNSGIRSLWYSGYKPDKPFIPLTYGIPKTTTRPKKYKVDRTLKQTPQPMIANISYNPIIKKLYKDKTKEEKEQDKKDKLSRAYNFLKSKGEKNPDKRTNAYKYRNK